MIILLAILGFIVLVRLLCHYYINYQRLKTENACLRRYWKEGIAGKP